MKKYLYPGTAVLLGAAGAGLRRWQLHVCFEEDGLPVPGLATDLLMALSIGAAALFLLLVFPLKSQKKGWDAAFGTDRCDWLKLSSLGYLLAGIAFLIWRKEAQDPSAVFQFANLALPVMLGSFLFASALAAWLLSQGGKVEPLAAMIPGFCSCFWLVNIYHIHANDPVYLDFAWYLLAGGASVMAWYEMAGFALKQGKIRLTLYWSMLAVTLSMICWADQTEIYTWLMMVTQALFFTVQNVRLMSRLDLSEEPEEPEAPKAPEEPKESNADNC